MFLAVCQSGDRQAVCELLLQLGHGAQEGGAAGGAYDLRQSFASFLINNGRSLYEVQKILGHTQVKTTQRYSHLAQETLLDAVNVAVDALGSAFSPGALAGPCAGLAPLGLTGSVPAPAQAPLGA